MLLGLTGVFAYNLFFLQGLRYIGAGRASLIIAFIPICITLLSALFFGEKLNTIKGLGILLSVSGAVVVISRGRVAALIDEGVGIGELYIFGCIAAWTAYTLIGKRLMKKMTPLVAVGYSAAIGALFLVVPALFNGMIAEIRHYTPMQWMNILYLACFGTVLAFLWFYEGVNTLGPTKTSVFINFVPVCTLVLSFLILGEAISPYLIFGAILVLGGVYLTNTSSPITNMQGHSDTKNLAGGER